MYLSIKNPSPIVVVIELGLWEVISMEGGMLTDTLKKETPEKLLTFHNLRTNQKVGHLLINTQAFIRPYICSHFGLGIPSIQEIEKKNVP